MHANLSVSETFLIARATTFTIPYLTWRIAKTDDCALLVMMPDFFLSTWLETKALIMIIFANVLMDKAIITSETFTALLLMAVASTMLTVPVV